VKAASLDELLLGIDIGTTAAKAALFTVDGRLAAVAQADYPLNHLRPNWVEQNPEEWWQAVCAAIQQVLGALPQARDQVLGVAISAQAPTLIALDQHGTPLRPALIWMDRRAENEADFLSEAADMHAITGNRADAFYVAPKLRWFRMHEPHLLAQTRCFVQINGYINYRLTGEFSLDPAHAGLLQLRDYRSGAWSSLLCDLCGVEPSQFPSVTPSEQIIG